MWRLNWIHSIVLYLAILCRTRVSSTQDTEIEVTLTRGTAGLGVHLVGEAKEAGVPIGAVVSRVVPGSAASLVLRVGDIVTAVRGVDIRQWPLVGINRLLGVHGRVKLRIKRVPQLDARDSNETEGDGGKKTRTASCYASIEGGTDGLHAFGCTPASFGGDLPAFSSEGSALPLVIAQPLDHCTTSSFNASGSALLVSRGGCMPSTKAANAARNGAEVMILVDGQYPPFPPLPSAAVNRLLLIQNLDYETSKTHDIPVLIVSNATGYRMISEIRHNDREVVTFSHAGPRPSRPTFKPKKQIPLDEAESLQIPGDAFKLRSLFRDGEIGIEFGEPGLSGGKAPAIYLKESCELPALLRDQTRRISFGRVTRCPVCNGRGAPADLMRPCKKCSSSGEPGVSTAAHDHSHEVEQTLRTTCSLCHGFGEVPQKGRMCPRSPLEGRNRRTLYALKNRGIHRRRVIQSDAGSKLSFSVTLRQGEEASENCERPLKSGMTKCKGERVIQELASFEVEIPKGALNEHRLYFPGAGSHFPRGTAGDVEVVVNVKPHERFQRDDSNLRTELPISLTEALSGFTREIELLNGSTVLLNRTRITRHNEEIEIEGGGLPVWDRAGGGNNGWDTHASKAFRASQPDKTNFGSTIVTCTVAFPKNIDGRLKGLGSAGENAFTDEWHQ